MYCLLSATHTGNSLKKNYKKTTSGGHDVRMKIGEFEMKTLRNSDTILKGLMLKTLCSLVNRVFSCLGCSGLWCTGRLSDLSGGI